MRAVVLGAGVVGVASAYWLLRDGFEVELVDRAPGAGEGGASFGNGALVHVSSVAPWSAPGTPLAVLRGLGREDAPFLLRPGALPEVWRWGLGFLRHCAPARHRANALANLELAVQSARLMGEIRDATGVRYDHAPGGRALKIYGSEAALDAAARAHGALAPHGLVTVRLGRAELLAREPALAGAAAPLAGGLLFPQDEIGDARLWARGLAAWAAARGAALRFGTAALGLEVGGGRVRAVRTDAGPLPADAVVVALGAGTPAFLRAAGLPAPPIVPVKGVSLTVPRAAWPGAPRHAVIDEARKFGLVPVGERVRVAGSAEVAPGLDVTPAPARIAAVVGRAAEVFPGFRVAAEGPAAVPWAGFRPMTPSGRPAIGAVAGVSGLFVNAGHGHAGWTMAAASGRRLAREVAAALRAGGPAAVPPPGGRVAPAAAPGPAVAPPA